MLHTVLHQLLRTRHHPEKVLFLRLKISFLDNIKFWPIHCLSHAYKFPEHTQNLVRNWNTGFFNGIYKYIYTRQLCAASRPFFFLRGTPLLPPLQHPLVTCDLSCSFREKVCEKIGGNFFGGGTPPPRPPLQRTLATSGKIRRKKSLEKELENLEVVSPPLSSTPWRPASAIAPSGLLRGLSGARPIPI